MNFSPIVSQISDWILTLDTSLTTSIDDERSDFLPSHSQITDALTPFQPENILKLNFAFPSLSVICINRDLSYSTEGIVCCDFSSESASEARLLMKLVEIDVHPKFLVRVH
jgi:hypothetical protein